MSFTSRVSFLKAHARGVELLLSQKDPKPGRGLDLISIMNYQQAGASFPHPSFCHPAPRIMRGREIKPGKFPPRGLFFFICFFEFPLECQSIEIRSNCKVSNSRGVIKSNQGETCYCRVGGGCCHSSPRVLQSKLTAWPKSS